MKNYDALYGISAYDRPMTKRAKMISGFLNQPAATMISDPKARASAWGAVKNPENWKRALEYAGSVQGAVASGAVDAAGDLFYLMGNSFEPVVNAFSPEMARNYTGLIDGVVDPIRTSAGFIRAATDGNPYTMVWDKGTWDTNQRSPDGFYFPSKEISWLPRVGLGLGVTIPAWLKVGGKLNTTSSPLGQVVRMAGGAGLARHGWDMRKEHPVVGSAAVALGLLGMAGPAGQGQLGGFTDKTQAVVNKFIKPFSKQIGSALREVPIAGGVLNRAIQEWMPTAVAVSPSPEPFPDQVDAAYDALSDFNKHPFALPPTSYRSEVYHGNGGQSSTYYPFTPISGRPVLTRGSEHPSIYATPKKGVRKYRSVTAD